MLSSTLYLNLLLWHHPPPSTSDAVFAFFNHLTGLKHVFTDCTSLKMLNELQGGIESGRPTLMPLTEHVSVSMDVDDPDNTMLQQFVTCRYNRGAPIRELYLNHNGTVIQMLRLVLEHTG